MAFDEQDVLDYRAMKDDFFKYRPNSPLTEAQKTAFDGLNYYPPNADLWLKLSVGIFEEQEQVLMQTNQNELKPFFRYGAFAVHVGGESATLTIYRAPEGHFFLPFVDANAGVETYAAGRYLDLQPEDDGTFVVDFNLAYNPYCAYNDRWVCPITPTENRIDLAIEAGEKLPSGEWAKL